MARPNSIVGSIVNSTRSVEWALNRLFQLGYDVKDVSSATGACPVAAIKPEETDTVGTSFDSIAYYGMAQLYVKNHDDRFKDATSMSSKSYGKSFSELLKESQGDYSKVDPTMFAPAKLMVNGTQDGSFEAYGKLNALMLLDSYGLKR